MDSATTYIAIYAAVLSTIAIIWNIRRETVRIKVTAIAGFAVIGGKDMNLIIIRAVSVSRRPVTITNFGIRLPDKKKLVFPFGVFHQTRDLPAKMEEGDYIDWTISFEEISQALKESHIAISEAKKLRAFVTDATGKNYYAKPKLGKLGFW